MARGQRARPAAGSGGQALVEFALILPLLLLVLLGIIQLGLLVAGYLTVAEAARNGARAAAVGGGSVAAVVQRTLASDPLVVPGSPPAVWRTACGSTPAAVCVGCTVTASMPVLVPVLWPLVGQAVTLRASSVMLRERP